MASIDVNEPDSGYTSRRTYDTADVGSIVSPGGDFREYDYPYANYNNEVAMDANDVCQGSVDYSEQFAALPNYDEPIKQVMALQAAGSQAIESFQIPLTASGTTIQTCPAPADPTDSQQFPAQTLANNEQALDAGEQARPGSMRAANASSIVSIDNSVSEDYSQKSGPSTAASTLKGHRSTETAHKMTVETGNITQPAQKPSGTAFGGLPVAPADLSRTKDPPPAFRFVGQKNVQWFNLRQQVTGSINAVVNFLQKKIIDNPQYCSFSVATITNVKQHKYSILEAIPSNYTKVEDYGFPDASPSLRASTHIPPILKQKAVTSLIFSYTTLGILQAFVWIPLACSLVPSLEDQKHTLISVTTLAIMMEALLFVIASSYSNSHMQTTSDDIQSLVFDASCLMASSLPRQMPSECGHSKYLRRQRISPETYRSLVVSLGAVMFLLLLYPVSISMRSFFPPIFKVCPEKWAPYITMIIGAVGFAVFFPASFLYKHCRIAEQSIRQSICCNLRGFYPSNVFALDYSSVHNIDEGLCYFFGSKTPELFIPFIAITSVALLMEPVDVRLRYRFNRKEIASFDGRHNAKVIDVARRGYDVIEEKDLLIWVIVGLTNELKLWLPLSMTQWNPCLFGFQGTEVATLLELAASAIDYENKSLDSNEVMHPKAQHLQSDLRNVAEFCRFYQEMRRETVIEETLHIPRITSFIVPTDS